jgi:hypothetical protein
MQMYGEKAEEAEELKMDLQDVKTMFREETLQLLMRVEELEGKGLTKPAPNPQ